MMDEKETLATIKDSLIQLTPTVELDQLRKKIEVLKDSIPIIVDLIGVYNDLTVYLNAQKTQTDLISKLESFEHDLHNLSIESEDNLHKISSVQIRLDERLSQLDQAEAKYQQLIEHVDVVLNQLETVLKRL